MDDKNFETPRDVKTAIITKAQRKSEESRPVVCEPDRNMQIRHIIAGKRPLHGMKELVSMAISRSLGESIILAPVTADALHPKPMHVIRGLSGSKI